MKKLLVIVVLGLLLSGSAYALPLKDGKDNKAYNSLIKNYNEFVSSYQPDVIDYCRSVSGGINVMIDVIDCRYNEFVNIAKRYEIFSDEVSDTIYTWYKNAFAISKSLQHSALYANSQRQRKYAVQDWAEKTQRMEYKLFKDLDIVIKKIASRANSKKEKKENTGQSGSGFFINKKGYYITNYHVIEGCTQSKITFNGKSVNAKVVATDQSLDLALLQANVKPKDYLNISSDPPEKMQRIIVAGYPFGKGLSDDLKFTQGIISSIKGFADNSNQIQLDAAINSGNSGGPIVNEDGDLVAVAVSGLSKSKSEGIGFGIKASSVKNFLNVNKVKYSSNDVINFGMNTKKLSRLMEASTVYTFCN
tara:strand:- start:39 stop:1124 length:1086 start_codon:yes stop_codon:yes gene_type:complete